MQLSLIAEHNEQLKRTQLQAENELREVPHKLTFVKAKICIQIYSPVAILIICRKQCIWGMIMKLRLKHWGVNLKMSARSWKRSCIFKNPKYGIPDTTNLFLLIIFLIIFIFRNILQEDRQRALLQLQWKVMSDKPKEDQEVNSKQVDLCFNLFVCVCLQMDATFVNFHVEKPLVWHITFILW